MPNSVTFCAKIEELTHYFVTMMPLSLLWMLQAKVLTLGFQCKIWHRGRCEFIIPILSSSNILNVKFPATCFFVVFFISNRLVVFVFFMTNHRNWKKWVWINLCFPRNHRNWKKLGKFATIWGKLGQFHSMKAWKILLELLGKLRKCQKAFLEFSEFSEIP